MQIEKIEYDKVPALSGKDRAYLQLLPALRPFFKYEPEMEAFRQVIEDKKRETIDRKTLVEVLLDQHASFQENEAVLTNIRRLADENTFTLTTAHQPCLFTGPLYYIYKIMSTLNLAEQLAAHYPGFQFVPVFISSGEDHDFEELNHLHLFNKTLRWESGETGAVGSMKTGTIRPLLDELSNLLGDSEQAREIFALLESTHTRFERFGDAAFALVTELFKNYGLVTLNTSDARLKRLFAPIIREEIQQQTSQAIVNQAIRQMEAASFAAQAVPREINFFYLGEQFRERIVPEDGMFKVLNTELKFSPEQMDAEIESHPERFSPNVVMRPLMQEKILPNLAYVGGGGEIAYWLERKAQFEHFGINFPVLVRRNSVLWLEPAALKRMEKLDLSLDDLWLDAETLVKAHLQSQATGDFELKEETEELQAVFQKIADKAQHIDPTLVKTVWAEHIKAAKSVEQLAARLVKAEKQKHELAIQQIRALKEKLFPGNGLQERYDNFLPYYLRYGASFFQTLKDHLDPFDRRFLVVKANGK